MAEVTLNATATILGFLITETKWCCNLEGKITSHFTFNLQFIGDEEVILILDPNLNLVAQLDNFEDFIWTRRWRKPGSFELTIDKTKHNAQYLTVNSYIAKKRGDVVHAGRIKDRQLRKDLNGEVLTVSGKDLGEIFENRIAFHKVSEGDGYDTVNTNAETAMKHFVEVNVADPVLSERKVENLRIDTDRKLGKIINYRGRFQKISEILYEISQMAGLGWDITLDLETKEFVFKVLYATVKTGIRLSNKMDSVQSINYRESYTDAENTVLIAGQGSGENRQIVEVSRGDL